MRGLSEGQEELQMAEFTIKSITTEHSEYFKDESRKIGTAISISFPETEDEIIDTMKHLQGENIKVTIQGARTGITAGAVPNGGHVLNLGDMNKITGLRYDEASSSFYISLQPGVLLKDLRKSVSEKDFDTKGWSEESLGALEAFKKSTNWFFPPDPTETTASIGGMAACNASGARTYRYGSTREYIENIRVILADGSLISLKRGVDKADGRRFSLTIETGSVIKGDLPSYSMPDVKNAAGYYIKENMDLIDLFIGSEGTLGIISGIELRLLKEPEYIWGAMFFFSDEDSAIEFVGALRGDSRCGVRPKSAQPVSADVSASSAGIDDYSAGISASPFGISPPSAVINPSAIEYFNGDALELLRTQKENNDAFSYIPSLDRSYNTAIYVEFIGENEDAVMEQIVEASEIALNCGWNESDSWVASTPQAMENMKLFRHAVPEAVNLLVDQRRKENPGITKLGTDMAVPNHMLKEIMKMYRSDLVAAGFESTMFGHIGNNHIHVNILPGTMEDYHKGKEIYLDWAKKVLEAGGTVSAEHGIGKLKVSFLELMYGKEGIREMAKVRKAFDPQSILDTGNLFDL